VNKMPMKDGKPAFIGDGKGMKKGGMAKMMKSEKASKMGKVATANQRWVLLPNALTVLLKKARPKEK
jgi:hypothetical protein